MATEEGREKIKKDPARGEGQTSAKAVDSEKAPTSDRLHEGSTLVVCMQHKQPLRTLLIMVAREDGGKDTISVRDSRRETVQGLSFPSFKP